MSIFNNSKAPSSSVKPTNSQNILGFGTILKGNIICEGPIRIEGKLEGNIQSVSKVIIGKSGEVLGDITARNIDVEGKFDGKILSEGIINIKATANVKGEVTSKSLSIEEGALFNAMSKTNKESYKTNPSSNPPKPLKTK